MRKKSRRGSKNSRLVSFLKAKAYAAAGLLLIAGIFAGSYFLRINQVTAVVDGELDTGLSASLDFLHHKSLFYTNLEQTALFSETLKNDQGQIYIPQSIEKKISGELIIYFTQEDPLYRLLWEEKLYSVNSKNFLAEDSPDYGLLTVTLSSDYQDQIHDNQINYQLNQTIQNLIQALEDREIQPEEIILDSTESYLIYAGNKYIFEEQAEKQLMALKISIIHSNLNDLDLPAGAINFIDLRFDLPVINSSQQLDSIQRAAKEAGEIELESELGSDEAEQTEPAGTEQESTTQSSESLESELTQGESSELESTETAGDPESSEEIYIDTPSFIE